MTGFVAEHRHAYGVESICRVLQIAPSTVYSHAARRANPDLRPDRGWRDRTLEAESRRVWNENRQVYGVRKVWKQLLREGWQVARCTVERLMRRQGLPGWSGSMTTDLVLEALEQALHARQREGERIHHSDRGSQYVSIRYSERLAEAGIEPSVGSVGDSYDNALAETINGLYKAQVIHRRAWRHREQVERATLH